MKILNVSCRGTLDNTLTLHVNGSGFHSHPWKLSFLFGPFVLFCFVFGKTYFHFLTILKYTGRLILQVHYQLLFLKYSNVIIHKLALGTL